MLLASLAWLLLASAAGGQTDLLGGADGGSQAGGAGPALGIEPIKVDLVSFGVGGVVRPGAWCGVRLAVTEQTSQRREVIVRIGIKDADGDRTEYRTVISTNPGVRQPVTLYVRLPANYLGDPAPIVGVYEALEASTNQSAASTDSGAGFHGGALGYREGALISQTRLGNSPVSNAVLESGWGTMLVVGNQMLGLDAYSQSVKGEAFMAFGHEPVRLARGVLPADLPDRWYGLDSFSEIVWAEGSPLDLSLDQARALREWVQRGGHLVIVLPVVGNDWLAIENRELASMLPRVTIERREAQPVEPYRELLAITPDVVLKRPITVHALDALAEADPREAMTILAGPDGRTVVSRRLLGVGAVTVVGLDLAALRARRGSTGAMNFVPQTSVSPGTPEADVFWHRVLGRRGALMSPAGVEAYERQPNTPAVANRTVTWVDSDLGDEINLTGQAARGVLLGIAVFAVYWLIAGPGGFFGLKSKDLTQHAWLMFVGAGLVFTGLAWGGAWAIKPKALTFNHITFLDHVFGERVQRTRTIASLMVPAYGEATVEVGTDAELSSGGRGRYAQVISPWEPSDGIRRSSGVGFPDSRGYAVDSRAPWSLTFPARSTVKQVEMQWLGGMAWQGIRPLPLEGEEFGVVRRAGDQSLSKLEGVLTHSLPGELTNVSIFVIERQAPLTRHSRAGLRADQPTGGLLTIGSAYVLGEPWAAGEKRDLSALTLRRGGVGAARTNRKSSPTLEQLMDDLVPRPRGLGDFAARPTRGPLESRLLSMSFFNELGGPRFSLNSNNAPTLMRRASTQTLDLSRWFTQPCVVVIGILELEGDDACPTPFRVRVNGQVRKPVVRGRTVVRWVYPLKEQPPAFPPPRTNSAPNSTPGGTP